MINILNIFIILKKVEDFSQNILQKLEKDEQGENWKKKSDDWIACFAQAASDDKFNHISVWIRKFNELLLQIQVATYDSK